MSAYFCPQRARSFRSSGGRRGRALDFFAYERRHLLAALRDFVPDVVHAHWTYEFAWAALDSGYPALATAHDSPWKVLRFMPNPYRAARYLMARLVIPRCTHLTAVSPDLAADIRKFTRIPVKVVANPIPPEVASALGCSAHAFDSGQLVMVLNGWSALKNGTTALRAFALARRSRPALRLVCLGNGWKRTARRTGGRGRTRRPTASSSAGRCRTAWCCARCSAAPRCFIRRAGRPAPWRSPRR
ncbi:MAG: glycosyltransferase [Burkholderiales bacterium]|nr:glycosyltransferase [Burkholderiales bacterium]